MSTRTSPARRARRFHPTPVLLVAVLALAGCQMTVAVDITVNPDLTGRVVVGVGLDDDALARAGDLDQQLRVDDVRAAGWEVGSARREDDGLTWVRASKTFAGPDQFALVMEELTGPDGVFRDWNLAKGSSIRGTEWTVDGIVDLTGGPESFSDPQLAQSLGGDPFGGSLAGIEQEEGRPIADLVDFRVTVDLPSAGAPEVTEVSFADPGPTQVRASSQARSWLATGWIVGLVVLVAVLVAVVLRAGFRRVRA
jgi:hypothetical protein